MPTKNARVNVVMEKPLYAAVSEIAEERGLSMSMVVRDLIREAIESQEDQGLARFAEAREATLKKALSHEDVWG
ncbi:MAG: antitoxin, RHH family protein [Syntrophus sp. (in: bacteria)]|nr:antitoxin, RHH family protein [Syntrophus sp. (in: bacteria)]